MWNPPEYFRAQHGNSFDFQINVKLSFISTVIIASFRLYISLKLHIDRYEKLPQYELHLLSITSGETERVLVSEWSGLYENTKIQYILVVWQAYYSSNCFHKSPDCGRLFDVKRIQLWPRRPAAVSYQQEALHSSNIMAFPSLKTVITVLFDHLWAAEHSANTTQTLRP